MKLCVILAGALVGLVVAQPPPAPIVIDGDFADWAHVPIAVRDAVDAGTAVDFDEVRVVADGRFLFVQLSTARAVNVQTLAGTLSLLVDVDADAATGDLIHGLPGVDLAVDLSPPASAGGVAVRRFPRPAGGATSALPSSVNFAFAPRYEATQFELRLDRNMSTKGVMKLVFVMDDRVRDETLPISLFLPAQVAPTTLEPADRVPARDPLARVDGTAIRVVVWNVSRLPAAVRDRFAATLESIDADVVMLDETARQMTATQIEEWLPVGQTQRPPWRALAGLSAERSAVAVRGTLARAFGKVPYPPDFMATFSRGSPIDVAIDSADLDDAGVGATGAVAMVNGRSLLTVPIDLASGGSPESGPEARRTVEAQAIRAAVKNATSAARPEGIIVGGDFNLVGTRDPLDILLRGLDLDGTALSIVNAVQLDGLSANTWQGQGNGGRFPPGRLDWLLYSDTSLELLGAFVFESTDLSPFWLAHHKLRANDTLVTSVHRPIVADFRWRR